MSLVVEDLVKHFGDKQVIHSVNFTAEAGKAFGLLGGNGAGKTTTIRMILGLINPDGGRITWNGSSVADSNVTLGYLPEERGLYPKSKVSDQLLYLAKLHGLNKADAKRSLDYWLERFGITEHYGKKVEELSKGNQQKVQLISALIHDPELIVFDEPFSGLDPVNSELLKDVIHELLAKKRTFIFSSHQMAHVEEFCENICIFKQGHIVLKGNLQEIKRSYGRTNVLLRTNQDASGLLAKSNVRIIRQGANEYELKVDQEQQAHDLLRQLMEASILIEKFEVVEPSLHEIFIEKVGS